MESFEQKTYLSQVRTLRELALLMLDKYSIKVKSLTFCLILVLNKKSAIDLQIYDGFPFILVVSGVSAGYVELFKVAESHFRICRVFVSNDFRGQGISKQMLGQLIELAKEKYTTSVLSLAVFEQNTVARNCYESLGFSITSYEVGTRSFEGEEWGLLHMEKRL